MTGFADDVAWLCEQADVERPVLVGHSMGGTVVLDVAARRAPRVVVMLDAAPGDWDGEAARRACRVPVLHIAADDPINDAAALRALNPIIRTGQTVGAGHFNQLQVPEQVNAMIERFLLVAPS